MMGEPKKKGALMALLSFGGKSSDKPEPEDGSRYSKGKDPEEEMSNEGASFTAASESLLQQLNVPEGRRDQVRDALKETIHACMRGHHSAEPDADDTEE
jgi:hypothetical protein